MELTECTDTFFDEIFTQERYEWMMKNKEIIVLKDGIDNKPFELKPDNVCDGGDGGEYVNIINSIASFYWVDVAFKHYNQELYKN